MAKKNKKWWQTKRRRNEKGHFVKQERPAWREAWWTVKKAAAKARHKVAEAYRKIPFVPGSKPD